VDTKLDKVLTQKGVFLRSEKNDSILLIGKLFSTRDRSNIPISNIIEAANSYCQQVFAQILGDDAKIEVKHVKLDDSQYLEFQDKSEY